MLTEFKLPELGENIEKGELVKVLVSVGDIISQDQAVIELETDKATIEVPTSVAGTVKKILVKEGATLKVGQAILSVEDGAGAKPVEAKPAAPVAPKAEEPAEPSGPAASAAPPAKVDGHDRDLASESSSVAASYGITAAPPGATPAVPAATPQAPSPVAVATEPPGPPPPPQLAPAAPSVRRQARELGIDINQVPGSGPAGRISAEDLKSYAKQIITGGVAIAPQGGIGVGPAVVSLPDFARWGEIERQPMKSIRRKTSEHLSYAWAAVPRVTQYDKADITQLEELRKSYGKDVEAAGGKLTLTVIALKVIAAALKVFPQFGASIDTARGEVVYKKYCHIGMAVDTDRGLLVPVVRDVDKKNLQQLAIDVAQLAEKARNKKIALEEMEGGVFSISNLGGIGGTGFSPIVNWPEVAILGIARAAMEPRYIDGQFQPRLMLPVSLSYDHRLIDGADGARFLRWVAEALEEPFRLVVHG
ncbi:MAG: 2-oxo acid dehydrogenase subunit E2 [Terriglobia bacterium]